jgi:hypothetical protein
MAEMEIWNRRANRERRRINRTFTQRAARKKFGYKPTNAERSRH